MNTLPVYTKEGLVEWADKIDSRLGPISGRDADALACLLRATAARMGQLETDRRQASQGWHHIRFGNPVPEGDEHVMLSVADYRRALHDRDFQELSVRGAKSR